MGGHEVRRWSPRGGVSALRTEAHSTPGGSPFLRMRGREVCHLEEGFPGPTAARISDFQPLKL